MRVALYVCWSLCSAVLKPPERIKRTFSIIATAVSIALILFGAATARAQQTPSAQSEETANAISLYRKGDIEAAVKILRNRTRKFKEDALAWHYLGLSLNSQEDFKAARTAFEKAITLQPYFAPSHSSLAYSLVYTKGIKDAQRQADIAFSLDPQDAGAHYVAGVISVHERNCSDALRHADALIGNSPEYPQGYLLKSQSLICGIGELSRNVRSNTAELSKEQKLQGARRSALQFKDAAMNLERFLQLTTGLFDTQVWRNQLDSLRVFAEPAEKTDDERTVFTGTEVTAKARVLSKPEPAYTETARKAQVVGTVVLRGIFASDGQVKHILVLTPLPRGLTEQAIRAAKKIKFQPAMKDGHFVSMYIQLEYNFNLY